jgi:hypothetical protein
VAAAVAAAVAVWGDRSIKSVQWKNDGTRCYDTDVFSFSIFALLCYLVASLRFAASSFAVS